MIDFTGRLGMRLGGRGKDVVERSGDTFGMGCVGLMRVVDHLVFVPKRRVACIEHEVFETTVARGRLLPIPLQVELFEFAIADEVTAAPAKAVQPALLNIPTFGRESVLPEAVPAVGRCAIEQEFPASSFFLGGELIGWGSEKQGSGGEEDGQSQQSG